MKRIKNLAMYSSLMFALIVPTITACTELADDEIELAEPGDSAGPDKADEATLALTPLDVGVPRDAQTERVVIIKSKTRWREVFGSAAPASINFSRQWVALYTAGAHGSEGHRAAVSKVRLSASGKTLTVVTSLESPGESCVLTRGITTPFAVVAFAKPRVAPTSVRYSAQHSTYSCDAEAACSQVDQVTTYSPSGDGRECATVSEVCISATQPCPQITPLPPTFCADGRIEIEPNYIDSGAGDGSKCAQPIIHCLSLDPAVCSFEAPPASACLGATQRVESYYIPADDGKECAVPVVHCLADDCGG